MAQTQVEVTTPTPTPTQTPAPTRMPEVWQSFRSDMDRLFDRFAGGFSLPSLRRMFDVEPAWRTESSFSFSVPAVDVTEDDKAYKITAELPGLEQKNLDITVSGDVLTLKGEKHYEKEEQDKNRHVSERAYGSFQRSFALPEGVDRDKIAADLSKGVLTLTLPKTAEAQKGQRKIEVKTAA
jgi:HSP20 family protein